ncbi:hypothetical protein [Nannocystis bainbridge]|uniref:Tetratricopeptide repeat protein n=1 Tax=Nannocystis bainbridge TaxID=2995303 RepID=A0ABT5DZR0_9BACT|nr:hypothetical protein [Nannocystis bainbridge]MDC0718203.1 hypothetical protein [Nannocystis bainbridge]
MRRLALVVIFAAGCRPASTATTKPEARATAPAQAGDPELEAVAAKLDPGPQPPLHEVLPPWLKARVESSLTGDPKSPKRIAEAREAIAAWDKLDTRDAGSMMQTALLFARGLILAERAVVAGSDDPELLAALTKAYGVVDSLRLFQRSALFGQLLELAIATARKEAQLEAQQIEEALAAAGRAVERAPSLHMHVTARLLREHPRHPTVPEVLVRASQAKREAEQFAEAVALRRLAVQRKGARATGGDYAELTGSCLTALDLACAEEARALAAARGPEEAGEAKAAAFAKRLADLDATATLVRRVAEIGQTPELTLQLERGHLLLKLNRLGDAEATFKAMATAHPSDARPLTGLAVVALQRNFDLAIATRHVRAARELANHDRLYYEVALGTVPLVMIGELATQMTRAPEAPPPNLDAQLAELMALVHGFRAHDPARAAVLELLFTLTREAMPKFVAKQRAPALALLRKLPEQALALTRKFPESRDAWRLVFSSTRLLADPRKVRLLASAPLPATLQEDPDLRLQQARAQLAGALAWEDEELLLTAVKSVKSLPSGVDADAAAFFNATVDAIAGREGEKALLQRAFDGFTALAERKTGKDRALALNNAALVVAFSGDLPAAMTILERAAAADGDELAARLNAGALAFRMQSLEGLPELFASVAAGAGTSSLRLQARAWLVALAEAGHGDVAVTREEFATAKREEEANEFRGRVPLGRWGVVEQGDFKVSLGYSSKEGLVLLDEVEQRWWLVVPPARMDSLLAEKQGPKKKKAVKQTKP